MCLMLPNLEYNHKHSTTVFSRHSHSRLAKLHFAGTTLGVLAHLSILFILELASASQLKNK